jgi:hypothetical protein
MTAISFLPCQQAAERPEIVQDAAARRQVVLELFQLVAYKLERIDATRKAAAGGFGNVLFDLAFDVVYLL